MGKKIMQPWSQLPPSKRWARVRLLSIPIFVAWGVCMLLIEMPDFVAELTLGVNVGWFIVIGIPEMRARRKELQPGR
jgi:hypothetical protein